eukprot:m.87662 g.87662  ORF g.87662 m.87662 type:complete len:129 (-) comp11576_c0_seq1:1104-1490(-)
MALRAVADVCVIGGGVMGTSAALMLARGGRSVCVIEPNRGVGLGSTSFSSGILRTYYSVLESTQFAWEGTYLTALCVATRFAADFGGMKDTTTGSTGPSTLAFATIGDLRNTEKQGQSFWNKRLRNLF